MTTSEQFCKNTDALISLRCTEESEMWDREGQGGGSGRVREGGTGREEQGGSGREGHGGRDREGRTERAGQEGLDREGQGGQGLL